MPLESRFFHPRTTVGFMVAGKGRVPQRRSRLRRNSDVELITDARRSPLENWHSRRRLYAALQIARIPLLGLAGLLMWLTNNLWLSASVAMISLPLPWVAVLLANDAGDPDARTHKVYKPQAVREARAQQEALAAERYNQLSSRPFKQLDAAPDGNHTSHEQPQIIDLED